MVNNQEIRVAKEEQSFMMKPLAAFPSSLKSVSLLEKHGNLQVLSRIHPRYVGARIGIHAPSGEKVGKVTHVKNTEYLYILGDLKVEAEDLTSHGWLFEEPLSA